MIRAGNLRNSGSNKSKLMRIVAIFAMILTIYALLKALDLIFMGMLGATGIDGCERLSPMFDYVHFLNPLVLITGAALQASVIVRPSPSRLGWAIGGPLLFWSFHAAIHLLYENEQRACAERSFSETLKYCKADPAWYQVGNLKPFTKNHFYRVVTVLPAGEADKSALCVREWSSVQPRIDKEVEYEIQ